MDESEDLLAWAEKHNTHADTQPISLLVKPKKEEITLYDYQQETFEKFVEWEKTDEQEALIALTVGLGKTLTASACVSYMLERGKKVLWLTHRDELIKQSKDDLERSTGEHCGVEKAEKKATNASKLVVASVQSLKGSRLEKLSSWFDPDLIVCDEAHHALAQTWMAIKSTFYTSKVLNLTATPYRSDVSTRLNLGRVLIEKNTTDGIKLGKLVPPKPIGKIEINLGKVKKSLGDYEIGSLGKVLCKAQVLSACVDLLLTHHKERRSIVFAANIEHGKLLAANLTKKGIEVGEIYGTTSIEDRKKIIHKAKTTKGYVLINNLVLTEGFNLPELDLVAIFRPTKNAALYLQMLGRGLRACETTGKKECLLIDIIDTAKRKTAEGGFPLPTEEDVRKHAAITGRKESITSTFIHWFLDKNEVVEVLKGDRNIQNCSHITAGEELYSKFFTKPSLGWRTYQSRVILNLSEMLKSPGSKDSDPTDLSLLFSSIRCGNTDAFVHLIAKSGWRYYPHLQLPETIELFDEQEEELDLKLEQNEGKAFNFEALISEDAELKNFIMDIFGDESSLGDQAKKYYDLYRVDGIPVVWYKPFRIPNANFHYIEPSKGTFWARTEDGQVYVFTAGKGFVSHRPSVVPSIHQVPIFNKSTQWADEPISEKQAIQVAKILDMDLSEIKDAHISRLSASALMSSSWAKRYLVKISNWLDRHHKPKEAIEEPPEIMLEFSEPQKEETREFAGRRFKRTT